MLRIAIDVVVCLHYICLMCWSVPDTVQHRPSSLHHTVWLCLQYYSVKSNAQPDCELAFVWTSPSFTYCCHV